MVTEQDLNDLIRQAQLADKAYYIDNDPIMSDYEYDQLIREIKRIADQLEVEPQYLQRLQDATFEPALGIPHTTKMYSLDNIYTKEELDAYGEFLRKSGIDPDREWFYCDLKLDGLALSVHYKSSYQDPNHFELFRVLTRGDGEIGEDVTDIAIHAIENLPQDIVLNLQKQPMVTHVCIRGECTISNNNLTELNIERESLGKQPYVSSRNASAAILRTKQLTKDTKHVLQFHIYAVDDMSFGNPYGFTTHTEMIETLSAMFATIPGCTGILGLDNVYKYYLNQMEYRDSFSREIDGIVFRIDNFIKQDQLGYTNKHPRFARALKFPAQEGTSVVKDIVVQVGRTGVLTPVVILDPAVVCSGVSISKATIHNEKQLKSLDIRIGDTVTVIRSGDVIPAITKVHLDLRPTNTTPFTFPKNCPACNSQVVNKPGKVGWYCINQDCPETKVRYLIYVASRNCYNFSGLGKTIIKQLYDAGKLKDFLSFIQLTEQDFLDVGYTETSVLPTKIIRNIQTRWKQLTPVEHIQAMAIPNVGESIAKQLLELCGSIEKLEELARSNKLALSKNIGAKITENITTYFATHEWAAKIRAFGGITEIKSSDPGSHC